MLLLLLLSCLLLHSKGETCSKDELEEMMDKRDAALKAKMEAIEQNFDQQTHKLEKNFEQKNKELEDKFDQKNKKLEQTNLELNQRLSALPDIPFVTTCAYQSKWGTPSAVITYDRISSHFDNADRPNGGDGDLNTETGVYTCLTAGHYTITYSGDVALRPGQTLVFNLYKNGASVVEEGQFYAEAYNPDSSHNGYNSYPGSRTLVSRISVNFVTS